MTQLFTHPVKQSLVSNVKFIEKTRKIKIALELKKSSQKRKKEKTKDLMADRKKSFKKGKVYWVKMLKPD